MNCTEWNLRKGDEICGFYVFEYRWWLRTVMAKLKTFSRASTFSLDQNKDTIHAWKQNQKRINRVTKLNFNIKADGHH